MSLADQKLETMPTGGARKALGVDSTDKPVLFAPWMILAQSSVGIDVPADTTEDTLVTVTIPGGTLGPNGRVRVTTVWSAENTANAKTGRVKWDGTTFGTVVMTSNASATDMRWVANRNSQSSQISSPTGTNGGLGPTSGTMSATAVNTASDTTITITGQKATAGERLTLESYLIEVLSAA